MSYQLSIINLKVQMSKLVIRVVFIVIVLYSFRQAYLVFSGIQTPGNDFRSYYTAAWLVRNNQSRDIYLAAENLDPSLERDHIDSGTAFAKTAAAHGVFTDKVWLYTYPPTLADLVVPLTFLSPLTALKVWYLLCIPALVWAGVLLVRMPGIYLSGLILPVLVFLLFPPTMNCLVWGQITIFLLLFLIAGISLYVRQNTYGAALLFALAIAIKLTPLILVIPLIAWRDWKMLRAMALWGMVILATLVIFNGWGSLDLYFFHEMPKIGTKFYIGNRSLGSTIQVLWFRSQRGTSVSSLAWTGKLISLLVLCYAGWQNRAECVRNLRDGFRVESIAYFLLLSCCVAPVSWVHAYLLSAPALVIYGKRIWEEQANAYETVVFLLFTLSLSTNTVLPLVFMTPLLGIVLGVLGLHRLKHGRMLGEVNRTLLPA